MRVLIACAISSTFETFLRETAEELEHRGHTVEVACAGTRVDGFSWSSAPFTRRPNPMALGRSYFWLRKQLPRFDLVQVHTPVIAALVRLATIGMRRPPVVVYMVHGFHFQGIGDRPSARAFKVIERLLASRTDHFQVLNVADHAELRRWRASATRFASIGFKADRVPTSPDVAPRDTCPTILFIGELNANKGSQLLREVIRASPAEWSWIIAGDGPFKDWLQAETAAANVRYVGHVGNVRDLLEKGDICMNLSFREGVPVSLLEAIASGLRIVGTRNRGTSELLADGRFGVLVDRHPMAVIDGVREQLSVGRTRPDESWLAMHSRGMVARSVVDDLERYNLHA